MMKLFDGNLFGNQLKSRASSSWFGQQRNVGRESNEYNKSTLNLTELKNRKLIKVSGRDAFSYIQLLTTNNIQQNSNCLNSYMITPNSRLLADLLIYKIKGDVFDKELVLNGLTHRNYGKRLVDCLETDGKLNESNRDLIDELKQFMDKDDEEILFLECDADLVDSIKRTLFVRRLGQDVEFEILNEHQIYSIYPSIDANLNERFNLHDEFMSSYFCFVNDPRLSYLGQRIVTRLPKDALRTFLLSILKYRFFLDSKSLREYKLHRYKLGVGEGLNEHLMAKTSINSFNADLLNGIDLYKGCFLGSAPVNRVLDRKNKYIRRLLPFKFINSTNQKITNLPAGVEFLTLNGNSIGELIGNVGDYGIGYFQLTPFIHINHSSFIKVRLNYDQLDDRLDAIVKIPFWWPDFKKIQFLTYENGLMFFKEQLSNKNMNQIESIDQQ